jgi:parvulin-like peptidyl-prolyl isomerase
MSRIALRSFVLALSVLGACQQPPPTPGTVPPGGTTLTTVNGNPVTQEMVDATLSQLPEDLRKRLEQTGQISQVQDQLVVGELLWRKALERNLHTDPQMQLTLALAQRNALADALLDKTIAERSTPERIQKYYDDHAVQYARPQAKLRVMVLESEAVAAEVKAQLDGGADFATLATQKSKDPNSAPKGGELGWLGKTELRGPLGEPVFAAEKGAVVGPIATPTGALLFKVEDKRDKVPLEEVKEEITGKLKQELAEEYIRS